MSEQLSWEGEREAFLKWREVVEDQGVFTYQMKFGNDKVSGICLWDESEIPVIIVNSAEAKYQVRTFSLWHEYAHIILRTGGISDQNRSNSVEKFCNAFAANFLLPKHDFIREAKIIAPRYGDWQISHASKLANRFHVSISAVAIRLEEFNLVSSGYYNRIKSTLTSGKSGGRADYHERIANRFGGRHIITVTSALRRGIINRLDAKEMLGNANPKYFDVIESEAINRQVIYGGTR